MTSLEREVQKHVDNIWRQISIIDSIGRANIIEKCGDDSLTELLDGARSLAKLMTAVRRSLRTAGESLDCGHIYPIYAKFKGGKGVATLLGIIFAIHPEAAGIAFGVFLITFLISKYVSLGALCAAVAFPFIIIFIFKAKDTPTLIYFSIVMSLLVIYTHRSNIDRLLKKEENKMKVSFNLRRNNK